MNSIVRRFMSGASLAALSFGVPTYARAASVVTPAGAYSTVANGYDLLAVDAFDDFVPVAENVLADSNHLPILFSPQGESSQGPAPHNFIDGSTKIEVFTETNHHQFIHEHDTGFAQDAIGTAGHHIASNTAIITKGAVEAIAEVSHGEGIHAHALAVSQFAEASGVSDADNYGANSDAFVGALATANHARWAHATATGLHQEATGGDAFNTAVNRGTIEAIARASHAEFAHANAIAIDQNEDPIVGYNDVDNTSNVFAVATANNAFHAHAKATGVHQNIAFADIGGNYVTNDGSIIAAAVAHTGFDATATAAAVHQHQYDVGGAYNALANSAGVGAFADAHGVTGEAFASAVGVTQHVYDAEDADNKVLNYASGDIAGFATARSAYTADAVGAGIRQHIGDVFDGFNTVSNTGVVLGAAQAHFAERATATAKGIAQYDSADFAGEEFFGNEVYNRGTVGALALAFSATRAEAHATAVSQSAYAAYDAGNLAVNYDAIDAIGWAYHALYAHADAKGIYQHNSAGTAFALNVVTNEDLIAVGAFAGGSLDLAEPAYYAVAHATGVDQYAAAHEFEDAKNEVSNFSSAEILAFASAASADHAYARARGIHEDAHAVSYASNSVVNFGLIEGVAFAHGTSNFFGTVALARASGVDQDAHARYTAFNSVSSFPTGAIAAFATATRAFDADAYAAGVHQDAHAEYFAHNFVSNGGLITANAFASNATEDVVASATGVRQSAGARTHASNTVNNNSGEIKAHATALDARSNADARVFGVAQSAGAEYTAANHVFNSGLISAHAYAHDVSVRDPDGTASALAVGVSQIAHAGYAAHNSVVNEFGQISAKATASSAFLLAKAVATGVNQSAHAGSYAGNFVDNTGGITAEARGYDAVHVTSSTGKVIVSAIGVHQYAGAHYGAQNTVHNTDTIHAKATGSDAYKFVSAHAAGVSQRAEGYDYAANHVTNDWDIFATAKAVHTASEERASSAFAYAAGVHQHANAYYSADNFLTNSGDGEIKAKALATGATDVNFASAVGVRQHIGANYAAFSDHVANEGLITASARANGGASQVASSATAVAVGVHQHAHANNQAYNTVTNFGTIGAYAAASKADVAHATAIGVSQIAAAHSNVADNSVENYGAIHATAYASGGYTAVAKAAGIEQFADPAVKDFDFVSNTKAASITAHAHAFADTTDAKATALAAGVYQAFSAGLTHPTGQLTVINHGKISANATAIAVGLTEAASAFAAGILQVQTTNAVGSELDSYIFNDGHIYAHADASAFTKATAAAYGIAVFNGDTTLDGIVEGHIINAGGGKITAEATATGGPNGVARAVGIGVEAKEFIGYITNSGTIDAQAFAYNARATGIAVTMNGETAGTPVKGHVLNNGGFIFASENTGTIGNAINVANAPNEVDITLEGVHQTGELYGNIQDSENPANWVNTITVKNGTTFMDGSINPGLATLANGGVLNINAGGTLWLSNKSTSFWGANPVLNVASYMQPGTLKVDVDAAGNNAVINAVGVSLAGGTLDVNPTAYTLFGNSTPFTIVNGANGGTKWTTVDLLSGSPLLSVDQGDYTPTTAGVTITRTAFNAVGGLTHNEKAVATGLENAYGAVQADPSANPAATLFYESIFQFSGAQYPAALNMLSGSQAGETVQSNVVSVNSFSDKVNDRMASMSAILGAGGQINANSDGITVWGSPYGSFGTTGSNDSGPSYSDSRAGIVIGADTVLNNSSTIIGAAFNYETNTRLSFTDGNWNSLTPGGFGGSGGWDVSLYGRYNSTGSDTPFYLQASGSYGTYANRTLRIVTMPLFGDQAPTGQAPSPPKSELYPNVALASSATGDLFGKFDSDAWSVYGEAGLPLATSVGFSFTPYVGVRYVSSSSGAYNETGSVNGHTSANLDVSDATANNFDTYLGAELSGTIGMGSQQLMPSLRVAWAHNFDDPWKVSAYFNGIGPTSAFAIDASAWSRDSGLVDLGLSMLFQGNMMATLGYDANLSSTQINQSVYGRLDIKF